MPNGASKDNRSTRYMQLGLGWIFVGAYAVENGRSIDIALLRATSLYWKWRQTDTQKHGHRSPMATQRHLNLIFLNFACSSQVTPPAGSPPAFLGGVTIISVRHPCDVRAHIHRTSSDIRATSERHPNAHPAGLCDIRANPYDTRAISIADK